MKTNRTFHIVLMIVYWGLLAGAYYLGTLENNCAHSVSYSAKDNLDVFSGRLLSLEK